MEQKKAFIDTKICDQNPNCISQKVCPAAAIEQEDGMFYVNTLCTGCGKCVIVCPHQAIKMV